MKKIIAGSLLALCALSSYSEPSIRQISSEYKNGFFLTNTESGYAMQVHNSEGFKIFDEKGDEYFSLDAGYRGLAMQGDYMLFSNGETTAYRCQLSNWNNQSISDYLSNCHNINTARVHSGIFEFNLSTGNSRSLNASGFAIMMSKEDPNKSSVIYPDGREFIIPQIFSSAYISDTSPTYIHFPGKSWILNEGGPEIAVEIDPSLLTGDHTYRVIGHTKQNKLYISGPKQDVTIPESIYTCEFNGESNSRDVQSFTQQEGVDLLLKTELDPRYSIMYKKYSDLSEHIAVIEDTFRFDFPSDITEEQFEQMLNSAYESNIGPVINSHFNKMRHLPCNAGTEELFNVKTVLEQHPVQLVNDNGDVITINIVSNWHERFINIFLPMLISSAGDITDIGSILSNFLLSSMSKEAKDSLLTDLIVNDPVFSGYPSAPADLTTLGFKKAATIEDLNRARNSVILEKLGFDLSSGSKLAWAVSLLPNGNLMLNNVKVPGKAWIIKFSDNSSGEVEVKILPSNSVIDPYKTPNASFDVEVSGSDIYALDVRCNIPDSALSINQAGYEGVFGDKKSMTLPLINTPSSVTGTETLSAPEQPLSGKGTFIKANVTAEFTTKDVDITCAADVSDINGKLLQVKLTPATIKIDDGVHGGNGSASGSISIPGVTDLSGIKVTLTIDGREVTVVTDKDGRFSFDGLRDGDFVISIASENYVQSCQNTKIADGASVDLGKIELLAGDINADGTIDIADFTFMAARYRSNKGDADYDVKADLNKDGTINIQDLAILGSHFGSTQCNQK